MKEKKEYEIRLSYETSPYVKAQGDPGDDPYRWHGVTGYTFKPTGLFINKKEHDFSTEIIVDFDPMDHIGADMHIVVVRFKTGGTFGSSSGESKVVGAFLSDDKLDELCDAIPKTAKKKNLKYDRQDLSDLEKIIPLPNMYYLDWVGYFEEFEGIERYISKLTIDNTEKSIHGKEVRF